MNIIRPKLYIFDISNFIHRAFHVHNELVTSYGFPSGAVYGTVSMMVNFVRKHKPNNILIAYDYQGGNPVRKQMYSGYKSNRVQVNAVSAQELVIRKSLDLLGMCGLEAEGYEADDVIGAAVKNFKDDFDIIIVTGDKDMMQLIEDGVTVYDSMKKIYYGQKDIDKKFGVRPDQIVDYLAIVGDKVDCIPGILGVGHVGAGKLLKSYDTLEGIYENLDNIKGATNKKLTDSREDAFLSQSLAKLFSDIDFPLKHQDVAFCPSYSNDLMKLLEKMEIKGFMDKLINMWEIYK